MSASVRAETGAQDASLISSATRRSCQWQDPWLCVTGLLRLCPFGELAGNYSVFRRGRSGTGIILLSQKKHSTSAEDECLSTGQRPGPKMHNSSLRQPGDPAKYRTRGFASPDCSGFARSEIQNCHRRFHRCLILHHELFQLVFKLSEISLTSGKHYPYLTLPANRPYGTTLAKRRRLSVIGSVFPKSTLPARQSLRSFRHPGAGRARGAA